MLRAPADRAPIAVRGIVVVIASVLFGTAAHLAVSGQAGIRLGSVFVTAALVAVGVSASVAAGAWLAGRSVQRRASTLEDLFAGIGLVTSQLLVHWLSQSGPLELTGPANGHAGHHPVIAAGAVHGGHAGHSGWGMAVAHAAAALLVGLLLRWLEACALGLATVVGSASRMLVLLVTAVRFVALGCIPPARRQSPGWDRCATPVLAVLATSVVRRGPPERTALA